MRAKHFLRGIIAASILYGPAGMMAATKTQILAGPTEVQGVPCQGKVELNENGGIKSCTLARNHTIAGYSLPTGTAIRFNEAGEVESFILGQAATVVGFMLPTGSKVDLRGSQAVMGTLRRDSLIRGVPLPANSVVFFRTFQGWESEVPSTWQCWLPTDTLIQGHLCASINDGCGHIFYPNGKLRAAALAQDDEIDGVPCTSSHNPFRLGMRVLSYGLDNRAWFYENGRLAQGLVSRDCTIEGRKFKPGDIVRLTPKGTLDPAAGTTLGANSRNADRRTPPESYRPSSGNAPGASRSDPH